MEIDLKWGLPLAMPLALVITVRICWWATGFAWEGDAAEAVSVMAILAGLISGTFGLVYLFSEGKKLSLRIGKPPKETPND